MTSIGFAGGGSGGHVYPLIAVANEIRKIDPSAECFFISSVGSIEEKLVPQAGYELLLIPSGKLKSQGLLKTLVTLLKMPLAFFRSIYILWKKKPDLVFSAGGYAGAPFLVVAALFGISCAILEQNLVPGMANKFMSKFCKIVFLNFSGSEKYFVGKKTLVVGHPCREEIEAARWGGNEFECDAKFSREPFYIFVFGGSQGAVGINRLVCDALLYLKDMERKIFFHHQTGVQDFENVKKSYDSHEYKNAKVEQYVYKMAEAYEAAHLVICRAGASSIAELAAAAKASFLIPLVSKDRHQEFNAEEMAKTGAAALGLQRDLTGEKLAAIIRNFYYNRGELKKISTELGKLHHAGAARKIAELCIGIKKEKSIL